MKTTRFIVFALATVLAAGIVAGCGGGGGGSATRSSTLGVFVTDGFSDDFSQVWITLFKIEVSDGSGFRTVFEDTAGKSLNASALASVAQLLTSVSIPAGNYTQARITIGDHITLVPKGGGASISAPVDDSVAVCSAGVCAITITASVQTAEDRPNDLVVDFDLPGFSLVGGKVKPHVKKGDDNAFHNAEKRAELEGTVSNLSATGFDLALGAGKTVPVVINDQTVVFSSKTGAAVTLQNGQKVEVKGTFDSTTRTVTAASVKVDDRGAGGDPQQHDNSEAEGKVASVDTTAKSFVLTLEDSEHLHPTGGTITVLTNSTTVFHRRHQDTANFADIVTGGKVEASGVFDSATQALTAKRVEIK